MARSPFQGNFQYNLRPTIVTAPDAVVYINGETDVIGCPDCKRKFDLSKYITSIQVSLGIESVPGSASVSLSIPRHAVDDFFFDGNPIITPMMEIEIFAKGYYILEGLPQYYPIFWGLVTEVTDDYSGGEHTVTIQCADILKWWDLCRMNINAAFTAPTGQTGRNIFGNTFNGMNPYDAIWTLAQQSFGDVIIGTGSLTSIYKENGSQAKTFNAALTDIMLYWEQRFSRVRSNLMLYGVNGTLIRGASLYEAYSKVDKTSDVARLFASKAVRQANGGGNNTQTVFDPTDPDVTAFRTQFMQAGQVNFWQSEYQTKLELAMACKEAVGFEFYMDVTGDIVFKPPFYNLDVLPNKPVSWIQDIDVIDWSFGETEADVVTQIQMQGSYEGNIDYGLGEEVTPFTSVTDYHLLRKYGWRPMPYNSEFMGDPALMFYHGLDILDRKNSRRHTANITIPCRPELRLGFPVYVAPKDAYWYVKSISHTIQFGGRATTQLELTARRCKWIAPQGIGNLTLTKPNGAVENLPTQTLQKEGKFHLEVGQAAQIPPLDIPEGKPNPYEPLLLRHPKTGRIVGYPNAVMVYTRPLSESTLTNANLGQKAPGANKHTKLTPEQIENQKRTIEDRKKAIIDGKYTNLATKYNQNRYKYGLTSAGVYVYAHDKRKSIKQFLLVNTKNITVTQEGGQVSDLLKGASGMIRPVSDERGFEVIGHFRYGRGIALRDGSLVLADAGRNDRANVQTQVALAGGLFETMQAQSQGLTTITNSYPNPAVALANLMPEDLQTAGTKTPEGKFEFVNADADFVQTAPLGSPEQKGLPVGVEAGQLSRALTLAELTAANQDADSQDCVCMTGRADLAFVNVGHQIKVLNPAAAESRLFNGTAPASETASAAAAGAVGADDPNGRPIPANSVYFTDIKNRVERYLTNLYAVLDEQHQFYEENLRTGSDAASIEARVTGNLEAPVDLFAPPPNEFGEFTPPFSSMNRAGLGDPVAIAQQGSSAKQDLGKSFQRFGRNLETQSRITGLEGEIRGIQRDANMARQRADQLRNDIANAPPNTRGDLENRLAVEEATIADLNSQIQQKQAEIDNLRASNV